MILLIEESILATDLAIYFKNRASTFSLLARWTAIGRAMSRDPDVDLWLVNSCWLLSLIGSYVFTAAPCPGPMLTTRSWSEASWWQPVTWVRWLMASISVIPRWIFTTIYRSGAITKPWETQQKIATLVSDEFFYQGDLEKEELHIDPIPMMDREYKDKLPAMQVYIYLQLLIPNIVIIQTNILIINFRWSSLTRFVCLCTKISLSCQIIFSQC